jgi:rod shape-determining protein MreC
MVALAGARPGWSRRAQYGLFFGFVAAVAAILVGLFMLILSLAAPQSYAAVRGMALDVTAPVTTALSEVATTATGLVSGAGDYWNAARQNKELKRQRTVMLRRMVEARAIALENSELKRVLALRERDRSTVASGRVVGSSFSSPRRFAILSVGRSAGTRTVGTSIIESPDSPTADRSINEVLRPHGLIFAKAMPCRASHRCARSRAWCSLNWKNRASSFG